MGVFAIRKTTRNSKERTRSKRYNSSHEYERYKGGIKNQLFISKLIILELEDQFLSKFPLINAARIENRKPQTVDMVAGVSEMPSILSEL